eukprot:TRINITY_DN166890_c0_g1_i1.p2 TRINITY_DN166890_c0_g1~~TRINITY_DN166890_c0_g1_i1.p2  ORF type:complete len:124 (-),score=0.21 TRINITY_DN166890_c0_g1_i1:13-384(-)
MPTNARRFSYAAMRKTVLVYQYEHKCNYYCSTRQALLSDSRSKECEVSEATYLQLDCLAKETEHVCGTSAPCRIAPLDRLAISRATLGKMCLIAMSTVPVALSSSRKGFSLQDNDALPRAKHF